MKKIIYLLCICLLFNCNGQTDNSKKETGQKIKKEMTNYKEIAKEKQIQYLLKVSIYDNSELEVFFNGYKLTNNNSIGGLLYLNKFLLKNGKYKIKLKFKRENNALIDNEFLKSKFCKLEFVTLWENGIEEINNPITNELSFNNLNKAVEIYEQEWEVTIDKLPYELKGWQHSKNFKEEDILLLKSKVVTYYQKIWKILNDGNTSAWEDNNVQGWQEKMVYEYFSKDKISEYSTNRINSLLKAKDKMHALEDYSLFISEDGKLIHLERIGNMSLPENYKTSKKANGFPALFSDDMTYDIRLHMPKGSNEFKIIR